MAVAPMSLPDDLPGHLQALSTTDLNTFEAALSDEARTLVDAGESADPSRLTAIDAAFAAVDADRERRAGLEASSARLAARIAPPAAPLETSPAVAEVETVTASAPALRPQGGAQVEDIRAPRKLNYSLSEAQRNVPSTPGGRDEAVILASADIPGVPTGGQVNGMMGLVAAVQGRARTLGDGQQAFVAQVQKKFKHTLGLDPSPEEIAEVLKDVTDVESLVAAGGWCAPSTVSYDLFNIAAAPGAGTLDLPRVGITRGGLRYPVSPSYANVIDGFAAIPTGNGLPLWSWTETQDLAAVTGTAQSGTKTCGRIPCVAYLEQRLACDGICLTAGNLMAEAFPENVANYVDLLMKAHAHKMNTKRISQIVGLSVTSASATGTGFTRGDEGVVAPVMGAVALAAVDYRARYAMDMNAVLEVILPVWIRAMMLSDLIRRTGVDMLDVAESRLLRMFDARGVRVQWVDDWQIRASTYPGQSTALTGWPTTVSFMIYAPGTFVLGEGLQLDLGVMRDSTLNATNDYTAMWTEECWLIAQLGHESRIYTVGVCADGTTGAANIDSCGV